MVVRMADAEHPLVAPHGPNTAADLIGKSLETELMIRLGQRAGDRMARSGADLLVEKIIDRLGEAPLQQVLIRAIRNPSRAVGRQFRGNLIAVQ